MIVLGIETTCDETAIAIVEDGYKILANVISSQAGFHRQFQGVFPEYASRNHVDLILPTLEKALKTANVTALDLDLIAVANRPGLLGPLLMGLNAAKALSYAWNIPLVTVNHLEAHLYAAMMQKDVSITFPAIGVVISGGHTFMVEMHSFRDYVCIGKTVDDAIGEAFDKVAMLLNLPYPGGPEVENLALKGDPHKYAFKPGHVKNNPFDFSFSGLKTQVLYATKGPNTNKHSPLSITEEEKPHIAAGFQYTALLDIITKSIEAAKQVNASQIFLGGGVTNNQMLKKLFETHKDPSVTCYFPPKSLSTDNGAMIAGLGYYIYSTHSGCERYSSEALPSGAALLD